MSNKEIIKEKISGALYLNDKQHNDKLIEIYKKFSYSNPLHGDIYPNCALFLPNCY